MFSSVVGSRRFRFMLLFIAAAVVVLPQQHLCIMASSTPVSIPVTVSTVTSSTLGVSDITITGNGDIIAVSYGASVVYRIYTAGNANSVVRIAGTANTPGSTDGIGAAARFRLPLGITSDTANDVAYIGDYNNHRIRKIDLRNNNVSTLAGSSQGNNDGIGIQAQFYCPTWCDLHAVRRHHCTLQTLRIISYEESSSPLLTSRPSRGTALLTASVTT